MVVAEDSADGLHIIMLKAVTNTLRPMVVAVTPFGCGDIRVLGLETHVGDVRLSSECTRRGDAGLRGSADGVPGDDADM